MEVYRIAPWFGLRLAGAFAKERDAVFVRLTRRYHPMLTGWDFVANRPFFVTPSRARCQRAFYLPPMPSNSEKSSSREWMSSLRYRFRTCVFTVCSEMKSSFAISGLCLRSANAESIKITREICIWFFVIQESTRSEVYAWNSPNWTMP